eukprot:2849668-Alexandrium_andersonii.AAC.1
MQAGQALGASTLDGLNWLLNAARVSRLPLPMLGWRDGERSAAHFSQPGEVRFRCHWHYHLYL